MALCACRNCGNPFEQKESWMVRCLDCWKESKGFTTDTPNRAAASQHTAETARLRKEIDHLRTQLALEKQRNYSARPVHTTQSTSIPEDMLGRLIRLAHPDRHNNSEASNKATAWLLAQRKSR